MRLTVESYNAHMGYHVCRSESGLKHRVDFLVDGALEADPNSLVGKAIECDRLCPFVELAINPRVCEAVQGRENP